LNTIAHATTALPAAPSTQRISQGVSDGLLLRRVQPIYPQQAMQMHTQGKVALQATIAKDGSVAQREGGERAGVLARSATDAVAAMEVQALPAERRADLKCRRILILTLCRRSRTGNVVGVATAVRVN